MDLIILNHSQVTRTTPELALLLTTTPHQREDVSAVDSLHHCPTRRVFSGTGLELVTKPATIRYLYHSATAATHPSSIFHTKPKRGFRASTDLKYINPSTAALGSNSCHASHESVTLTTRLPRPLPLFELLHFAKEEGVKSR
ncbi:uncharacterized protein TNCV_1721721 [Trichonephila clavipes]|nr:uncharacterized protein TNCV_1721721 [Trichonephila clavipes]